MSARRDDLSLGSEDFYFLPLGGSGEIGMNFNLYGHDGRWLIVDLGVTFGSSREPGVDVMMADPAFVSDHDAVGILKLHFG